VHVDNRVPYWIYSNRQDDGTMRGPSTSSEQTGNGRLPEGSLMPTPPSGGGRGGRGGGGGGFLGRGRGAAGPAWQPNIGGGGSGFTIPDPIDADVVYASCYGHKVPRWDARTGTARWIQASSVVVGSPQD